MNLEDTRILGNIIDPTFNDSYEGSGSYKILPKIIGDGKLEVVCMTVVNLLNRSDMHVEAKKAYEQLDKACNECLKEIKKEFKSVAGRALKTKKTGNSQSVELINMSSFSPNGTALARNIYSFEIS
tara:strand:+ start:765 stop:1142 length:378 start_codon:yes stop_codon:yes gene_type:complete